MNQYDRIEDIYDFKNPQISQIFATRIKRLKSIKNDKNILPHLFSHYKKNPAQFIIDWGCTVDYTSANEHRPAIVPFILFPKQIEWVEWVINLWKNNQNGLTEKTRQMGMSWLSVATAVSICLFNNDIKIGFGSRKEEYVDKRGDSKSLFEKAKLFIELLPAEFNQMWDERQHRKSMQIKFPLSNSTIIGESGDNIGRGDTTSIYLVDEAAFLERPYIAEASLAQGTRCRIDISTPNGTANAFYEKRMSGKTSVFTFHWRDDPRKDENWYNEQIKKLDPVIIAQEIDINYNASVEWIVIPSLWVESAIDAHLKLKIKIGGIKKGALDIADEGKDLNAFCGRHGIIIECLEEWSGKNSDIGYSTQKAFDFCDQYNYNSFDYDADGLGVGVKGFARLINENRYGKTNLININKFRGSESVIKPEEKNNYKVLKDVKNKDLYVNLKAQSWFELRQRFEKTYNLLNNKIDCDYNDIISIPSSLLNCNKLCRELSQPTYTINNAGKIIIDKKPEGTKSPNLADAVMMCFAPINKKNIIFSENTIRQLESAIY